jgi:non-ribosomal peptide synthase protein (TIGR01720 family)
MNPKQIEEFFHLSPVQKQLLRQSEQAAPATYLAQFRCQLEGPLDVSAFERAWQKVTNRQPGLRMTFVRGDLKEPVQIVNRNVGVALEKQDWRNLAAADQTRRLEELLQADQQDDFALKTPPLWRMTLIRLGEERYYFVWTYHELLFDERALPVLFNEALAHYDAILKGKSEPLLLPVSLRKYIEWGRKQDARAAENFWRKSLRGFVAPTPIELTKPETPVALAADTTATLKALAAQQQFAPEVLVCGAWALLLSRLSGQADVLFGVTISGRPAALPGANRLIGHLRNTLPLRVRIVPEATALEWLTDLQKQWAEVQHYGFCSLAQIQSWSEVPATQPLLQSVVVFDAAHVEAVIQREIAGLQIREDRLLLPNHFPLAVMIRDLGTSWELTGDAHTVHLRALLEQFAIHPQRRLAEMELPLTAPPSANEAGHKAAHKAGSPLAFPVDWLNQSEEEQGWVDWLKAETCVHEMFEQRVARAPEAVAVRLNGRTLTYQELNARANQLARYLRKLNVVPSIPVGLCFAPALEAVIGMLGVLKAGGAYLPLEATLSAAELQQVLTEAAVTVLLTQAALEPKFRAIPVNHLVLCLDSDWQIIAAEETANLACQVSDEHPACVLAATEAPAVITHARLAKAVGSVQEWFGFENKGPWHLFDPVPPEPAPPADWEAFDLTPTLETWAEPDLGQVIDPEIAPDLDALLETTPALMPLLTPELEPELELENLLPVAPKLEAQPPTEPEATTLAPIQQWFFAQHPHEPQQWNLSLLVEISDPLDPITLAEALQVIVAHHDALRWRFVQTETGWQRQEAAAALPFAAMDFSTKWASSQRKAIEETAAQWQTSLHLSDGPLWRAAYFDLGAARSHRLLVIAHHLIADETSLRLFLHDWLTTYQQLRRNETLALPPQTISYQEWLQTLVAAAQPYEIPYWQAFQARSLPGLPIDHPDGENTYGDVDRVIVSLNSKETESLLHHVPAAAEAEVNEIVLTALTLALAKWAGETAALLELERDARKLSGVDFACTMGWFAAKFPVWLEVGTPTDVTAALQTVKTQLRAVPSNGLSYGVWRCHPAAEAALRDVPQPQVSFKYLAFPPEETAWRVAPEAVGLEHHPHNERAVLIAVTGAMNRHMLEFRWDYARAQIEQKNIGLLVNGFIEELRQLIHHFA